jgi:hypothetical protein
VDSLDQPGQVLRGPLSLGPHIHQQPIGARLYLLASQRLEQGFATLSDSGIQHSSRQSNLISNEKHGRPPELGFGLDLHVERTTAVSPSKSENPQPR